MKKQLDRVVVPPDASIRTAMEAIDRGAIEIALVVDHANRLLGTVTDGDIRRAVLGGATLEAPVSACMQRQFTAVGVAASRAEVLDLLRARSLRHVPVLEEDGRLLGLHVLQEIVGGVERPNWAVVLAGGRGERLRPLTDALPKPMVRVAGRPILERIVLHLVGSGIRRVFLSVNYLANVIESHFGDGSALGCRIEYLREDTPLGTGGPLALLPDVPADPLLVVNGDLLTQFDAGAMLAVHGAGGYRATIGVHRYVHAIPYGVVEIEGSAVVQIREKPAPSWLVNAGIYALEPELLSRIPRGVPYALPALIEECLERGELVGAFQIEKDWIDVGEPTELKRAQGVEGV